MAKDWAADVKKYIPGADDTVIAGIVSYCGIALQSRDASLVAFKDPAELAKVKENFLRKKLALTDPESVLDQAIAAVGARLKGVNFKNRPTVYYMLLEELGQLHKFGGAATSGAGAAAGLAAGAVGLAGVGAAASMAAPTPAVVQPVVAAPVVAPAPVVTPMAAPAPAPVAEPVRMAAPLPPKAASYDDGESKGGMAWLWWLLLGLGLLALLWWLFLRPKAEPVAVAPAATEVTTTVADPVADANAMATVEPAAPVAIPQGAGVVAEMRDGKPLVKVFFDTAKADVVPAFTPAVETLKTYMAANPGTSLGVSGYNDPTGNAAANAALSKRRAQAVQAALTGAGVAATSIELIKPAASTDTTTSKDEARRVEVYIK